MHLSDTIKKCAEAFRDRRVPDHSISLFQDIASICPRINIYTTKIKKLT